MNSILYCVYNVISLNDWMKKSCLGIAKKIDQNTGKRFSGLTFYPIHRIPALRYRCSVRSL